MAYSDFTVENLKDETLYGCSTTGIEWRFLTLRGHEVTVDEVRHQLAHLDALLGTLLATLDRAVAAEKNQSSA
jgi:hypothetical protein